jgi:predicted acylesterase/phospholipase RssA
MMQRSILQSKVKSFPNIVLLHPPVDAVYSQDFHKAREILPETKKLKDEVKRAVENVLGASLSPSSGS